jgi:quinol monooxygenase YgiN
MSGSCNEVSEREKEAQMTLVIITIHVLPTKRKELFQTLHELMQVMPQNPGYRNARLTINSEDPNLIIFAEAWKNQQAVENYMQSEHFNVLQGALKLLTASSEMTITPVARRSPPRQRAQQQFTRKEGVV